MDSVQIVIFVFATKIIDNMGKSSFFRTAGIWTANNMLKKG